MSDYLSEQFTKFIKKNEVNTIFECGSRDLLDAISLYSFYKKNNPIVYAFECNPDGLQKCKENYNNLDVNSKKSIKLIEKAIFIENKETVFKAFDLSKYNNMGASSLLKIDFSTSRQSSDLDYNRGDVQKNVIVSGIRLDTFCENENIQSIDLLCMDLQEYELEALKSLGNKIKNVKYIISEACFNNTYENGNDFNDLHNFLIENGFEYKTSNVSGEKLPVNKSKYYNFFDVLYINKF